MCGVECGLHKSQRGRGNKIARRKVYYHNVTPIFLHEVLQMLLLNASPFMHQDTCAKTRIQIFAPLTITLLHTVALTRKKG